MQQAGLRRIVRAVVGLSNELGMATTAEGVETQEQLEAIARSSCTDVRGYLFSPPAPEIAVPESLRTILGMPEFQLLRRPLREMRALSGPVG